MVFDPSGVFGMWLYRSGSGKHMGTTKLLIKDISSCFDTIDHDLLMRHVQRRIRYKWILRLAEKMAEVSDL